MEKVEKGTEKGTEPFDFPMIQGFSGDRLFQARLAYDPGAPPDISIKLDFQRIDIY